MTAVWKTLAVARKEMRQIGRDRRTLLILLFVPVFFLLVYGYALNFDIRNVRIAVQDNDRHREPRRDLQLRQLGLLRSLWRSEERPGDLPRARPQPGARRARDSCSIRQRRGRWTSDERAVHRQRRQREHRDHRRRLRARGLLSATSARYV